MEIRNLITFVQVAELNSFSKAAKALDYSQSTVSFQIKQLETELNCLLFERINHTISLTEEGRELLIYAQQICHLTNEFRKNLTSSYEVEGFIHIATPDSICEHMITRNYVDFHNHYPGISLKFTTGDTAEMLNMLNHNEIDLMLALDSHIYMNDYIIAKEERVDMHFVTGAASPFASNQSISIRELAHAPFILTEKGEGYRRVFDQILASHSLEIIPLLEIGRTDIIIKTLEKGFGISYLPDFVTEQKIKEGTLVYIDVIDVEMDIWKQLIYHKNKWISKELKALIEYIKKNEFN